MRPAATSVPPMPHDVPHRPPRPQPLRQATPSLPARPGAAALPGNAIVVNRDRLHPSGQKSRAMPAIYTDETCLCRGCQKSFVFTAAQKQRLYEEHRAHPATRRVLCGDCKDDLARISQELLRFDAKLKPKDQKQDVALAELVQMMALLKRKFVYTQKVDKSKLAQYRKIHKALTAAKPDAAPPSRDKKS